MISINTVDVVAGDDSKLLDLIIKTRENQAEELDSSKAYYQLKSYINKDQVELVEGFYNSEIQGYSLEELYLKTGKVGLRETNNRFFMSLETSKAISGQPIFNGSTWFPRHPLHLSKRKIKKFFYYELDKKYIDDDKVTVLVIHLFPKIDKQRSFETWVWLKPANNQIIKLKFEGKNLLKQPFIPLFDEEKIENTNLQITKSYEEHNGRMLIKHIDFNYDFDYHNRGKEVYKVYSKALIENYDFNKTFALPFFEYPESYLNDYQKVQAIPFNSFFWQNHNELSLNNQLDSNERFFSLMRTKNISELYTERNKKSGYVFEQVFVPWSVKRVMFLEFDLDTDTLKKKDSLHLKASIFIDINKYNDSIDVISSTILDPYESYFKLELDSIKNCFVNIYFDLMEIKRREMIDKINKTNKSPKKIQNIYSKTLQEIKDFEYEFFESTEGCHNQIAMRTYNQQVRIKLGIDNIEIFQVYKK